MAEPEIYSQRLGAISVEQFQAVAARLNLGRFVAAERVTTGLFGQNVFMRTSAGEFVLRGAPHWVQSMGDTEHRREDRWQFTQEVFFARQLHERTTVPVAWPMLHDERDDIFGWPYVVMPRMPGECFDDRRIVRDLEPAERSDVARALGLTLAEMQTLTWPFAGDFDRRSIRLEPYPGGGEKWVADEVAMLVDLADRNGAMTLDDRRWIDDVSQRATRVRVERPNTYTHCDYKLNNLTVGRSPLGWAVTGLFDLHEARFADGALDIVRQACAYLDNDPPQVHEFIASYRAHAPEDPSLRERVPLYLINDRLKFWTYFTRPDARAAWTVGTTFKLWASRYLIELLPLIS